MDLATFYERFHLLADAPNGVQKLREMVLQLAVQGKLTVPSSTKWREEALGNADNEPLSFPNSWTVGPLERNCAEIMTGPFGSSLHKRDYVEDGIPVVNPSNMKHNRITADPKMTIGNDTFERLSRWTLKEGDVVVARRGEMGRCAMVTEEERGWLCGTGSLVVRTSTDLTPLFLTHVLRSSYVRRQLSSGAVGATMSNLSQKALRNCVVAVPPLAEQHRIVAKVDELMALCDELEERQKQQVEVRGKSNGAALDRLLNATDADDFARHWKRICNHFDILYDHPDNVTELRKAILQLAVQGKLVPQDPADEPASKLLERIKAEKAQLVKEGKLKKSKPLPPIGAGEVPFEVPVGWEWVRFYSAATIQSNLVKPEKFPNLPHVAPDNIEKGTGRLLEYRTVAEDGVRSSKHLFRPGQIVYSKIRPNLSKVVAVDFEGLCSADMYPVLPHIDRAYMLNFLLSDAFLKQVVVGDNRVAMPKVNQEQLRSVAIAVPSLPAQHRIVAKVDELMALCDDLESGLRGGLEQRERLAAAMAGTVE